MASGAIDGIINLFDLQTGRLLHTLEGTYTGSLPQEYTVYYYRSIIEKHFGHYIDMENLRKHNVL